MAGLKDFFLGDTPYVPPSKAFDGATYKPERDYPRLSGQLKRVFETMRDGEWHSPADLVAKCGGTEASVTARARDLRKRKYGGHVVERRYWGNGLHQYRLRGSQS